MREPGTAAVSATVVDNLHREWLAVTGTGLWLDVAYRLLLGREPEPDARLAAWRRLAVEGRSRRALLREIVSSREFAEAALIEELSSAVLDGRNWSRLLDTSTAVTERAVEVPWVLGRYRGERRVLDVGIRHASDAYVTALLRVVDGATVIGVDLVMCSQRDVLGLRGDVRALPIAHDSIDFAACVSTIEHVGHDNSRYGATATRGSTDSTVRALAELRRVLSRRGRLLVTVPVGRPEDHGWFRQFDVAGWRAAVAGAGLHSLEEELFARDPDGGWRQCGPADVVDVGYGTTGPGAGAVLCTTLVR